MIRSDRPIRAGLDRRAVLAGVALSPIPCLDVGAAPTTDRDVSPASGAAGPTVVFDVTETLLDLSVLSPVFVRIFGTADMLRTWFDQAILYAEALTLSGAYVASSTVGLAVLRMLAEARGRAVEPADIEALKRLSDAMPTYTDTPKALADLAAAGFRLVTLSNTPSDGVEAQLTHAGIREHFAEIHSIDDRVRRYKPARESYAALATTLGVTPSDLWLVSCHAFDTLGAAAAGYRTALVLRPGNAPIGLGKKRDIIAADFSSLVYDLIRTSRRHD